MGSNPKRPAFFACKFGRLLTKTAAAMTIGADACWLLTIVSLQEDSIKYARPVNYWNEQLQTLCGFGSKKRLVTARTKAVEAGWLKYTSGSRTRPGTYQVKLPDGIKLSEDGPCHESDLQVDVDQGVTNRNGKVNPKGGQIGTANDSSGNESERIDSPTGNDSEPLERSIRNGKSAPSIPTPNPKKRRSTSFVAPSIEEVNDYAGEYESKTAGWPKRTFDADALVDHYAANGWKQSNGNAIKDWKATVRNWGRRNFGGLTQSCQSEQTIETIKSNEARMIARQAEQRRAARKKLKESQ